MFVSMFQLLLNLPQNFSNNKNEIPISGNIVYDITQVDKCAAKSNAIRSHNHTTSRLIQKVVKHFIFIFYFKNK